LPPPLATPPLHETRPKHSLQNGGEKKSKGATNRLNAYGSNVSASGGYIRPIFVHLTHKRLWTVLFRAGIIIIAAATLSPFTISIRFWSLN